MLAELRTRRVRRESRRRSRWLGSRHGRLDNGGLSLGAPKAIGFTRGRGPQEGPQDAVDALHHGPGAGAVQQAMDVPLGADDADGVLPEAKGPFELLMEPQGEVPLVFGGLLLQEPGKGIEHVSPEPVLGCLDLAARRLYRQGEAPGLLVVDGRQLAPGRDGSSQPRHLALELALELGRGEQDRGDLGLQLELDGVVEGLGLEVTLHLRAHLVPALEADPMQLVSAPSPRATPTPGAAPVPSRLPWQGFPAGHRPGRVSSACHSCRRGSCRRMFASSWRPTWGG